MYVAIVSVIKRQLSMLLSFCVELLNFENLFFVLINKASLGFESDVAYVRPLSATYTNYRFELETRVVVTNSY